MSILREILEYMGLAERKNNRRPKGPHGQIRYAHPSHDPGYKSKSTPSKPVTPVRAVAKPDDMSIQSFDEVFQDMRLVEEISLSYIHSCGDVGAGFADINLYVLGKLCVTADSATKRAKQSKYKDKLADVRNSLKKDGHIIYDSREKVWKSKPEVKKKPKEASQKIRPVTSLGRELTERERAYFNAQGIQDGDGWRKIDNRIEAIEWIFGNFTPLQFENFCVSILSSHCNVPIRITQKNPVTGSDGGFDGEGELAIDGIVRPIAMQAKCYAPHRQVGYDYCERFAGGLHRRSWKHGFMMTTGTFSENAWQCVDDFAQQGIYIELIDQNRLLDIMMQKTTDPHGYGLHETQDYKWLYMNEDILRAAAR